MWGRIARLGLGMSRVCVACGVVALLPSLSVLATAALVMALALLLTAVTHKRDT